MPFDTTKSFDAPRGIQTPNISPIVDSSTGFTISNATGANQIVVVDTTSKQVGINISPTANLHVAAGTASAGTAPIKLTAGTALSTPEDGAVEYHNSHLYFTIGSTRYQLDQQGGGSGAPFETSTGNIKMDGTASVGVSSNTVRSDHVHPSDTSKVNVINAKVRNTTQASLSAEYIANAADRDFSSATGNWSGTNWSISGGVATHTTGGANTFSLSVAALNTAVTINTEYFVVSLTVITTSPGYLSIQFGTQTLFQYIYFGVGTEQVSYTTNSLNASVGLDIVPYDSSWLGSIDNVSIKKVTENDHALRVEKTSGSPYVCDLKIIGDTGMVLGAYAGRFTTGSANTLIGTNAGMYTVSGYSNTALGASSLSANNAGYQNVAVGAGSLQSNILGSNNTAIGSGTLGILRKGDRNIAIGDHAGSMTASSDNLIIDNRYRGNESLEQSTAIIVGKMGDQASDQTLRINGRVGITVAPTSYLTLPAGDLASGTAPLKFTSGSPLTIPEDGAVEYHNNHLYFTVGSTRYQLDQQASSISFETSTGNILMDGIASVGVLSTVPRADHVHPSDTSKVDKAGSLADITTRNHNDTNSRDVAGNHAKLIPATDSTTAIQITKADSSTGVVIVDTTNSRLGVAIAPTAKLTLPAGTATAGSAPLKLTSGTALATPEDGAIEYHNSHIYATIGSTRYQLDQQPSGITAQQAIAYALIFG